MNQQKYRIGLVMKSLNANFFQVMQKGALNFADEHPEIDLICRGTTSQTDVDAQIGYVDELIQEKVDAIVLVPIDSVSLAYSACKAVRNGIRVVNIDIKLDDAILNEQHVNIPFVGPDNYKASYEVGKLLVGSLHRGDEVAIIEGLPSADNASQRKAGSLRVIQEEGYKLVASEPANWETADARNAFSRIWSQNPDLKGVFCGNDAMALGVLQEMDIQRKYLPVVGFDNDGVMLPYLRKGQEIGTVDIFSSQMAVEGIRYAINMIRQGLRTYDNYSTPFKIICGGSSCGLS